jgi:hypothetical protein
MRQRDDLLFWSFLHAIGDSHPVWLRVYIGLREFSNMQGFTGNAEVDIEMLSPAEVERLFNKVS